MCTYVDVNNSTNEEIENPPLVLAALKLPNEIFNEESVDNGESVDEVDFPCIHVQESKWTDSKLKRKTTFHALLQHDKVDVNSQNRAGITALHVACNKGNCHMVNELLQVKNIEINKKDKNHNTPLHAACARGNQNIVESLIKAGADCTVVNDIKRHPLHVAVVERNLEVVITILRNAASANLLQDLLDARDKRGFTVFLLAVQSGDEQTVKHLLEEKHATISDKCGCSFNSFHYAASRNKDKILQMIYGHDESISVLLRDDAMTISGDTPLHVAAEYNQVDALKILIKR